MRRLSRRTLLRGAGVAMALPWLDAITARGSNAAAPPRRLVCINTTLGLHAENFYPKQAGRNFEASQYLQVIDEFRGAYTVFSGLTHPEVDGSHASAAAFLTGAPHPGASSFKNTISLDQFALEQMPIDTRFASLQLSSGGDSKSMSFNQGGVMLPAEYNPATVFQRLFVNGTAGERQAQLDRLRQGQSIMDSVLGEAGHLQRRLGRRDSEKLDQYFTSVREVESRLAKAEVWSQRPKPAVNYQLPRELPSGADLVGRIGLMFDMVHLALETDSTRLITLALEPNGQVPPIEGVSQSWHNLSHHGLDSHKLAELRIIELEQMKLLRGLLAKLHDSREADGSVLDHSALLFGSNLGNASSHDTRNMPIIVAGGHFRHGQHLAFDPHKPPPLCNLYVQLLQHLGVEAERFSSSTGTMPGFEPA